ncbi:unnamed protein product [Caenorhabditis bovis]|uniref:CUB domain-containing protein n=1 Tax=Caenorhabditis bovis TaxID=2654633 RepID=A0A8S1EB49_9PELO|nr:unnamed protein product [Caenorhabditis bovis]
MMRLVLLLSIISAASCASECPKGWTFSPDSTQCYTISESYYNFDEALKFCDGIGGILAFAEGYKENTFFKNFTSSLMVQPWMGVRRNATNGKFQSVTGKYFYNNWLKGEPSANGDCATYRGIEPNGMKVTPCYNMQPALCKQMPALCPNQTEYGGSLVRHGTIKSPGYPVQYYNNLNCVYTIHSPAGTYITIQFDPYLVENYYDYISVYDGNSTSSKYLGTTDIEGWYIRNDFESSDNALTFKFHTDSTITKQGWLATWNAKPNMPPIRVNGSSGELSSPNYPNNYDPYTEQAYYITGVDGFSVNVTFDDFITEQRYDYVEIYNSSTISTPYLVTNLTGPSIAPYTYISPGKYVTLRFITDSIVQKKGWHLIWSIV